MWMRIYEVYFARRRCPTLCYFLMNARRSSGRGTTAARTDYCGPCCKKSRSARVSCFWRRTDRRNSMKRCTGVSTVVEYAPPGASESKAIWEGLVAKGKVVTDESVDWDAVALKYELSGGFIKNALLAAVLFALARSKSTPIVSEQDVRRGCALQQRGAMHKHHALLGKKEDDDSDASFTTLACGRSVGESSNI